MTGQQTKLLRLREHQLNVLCCGPKTAPALVFLHNGGGTLWNWWPQIEHFQHSHRVIALDLLGFGQSDKPKRALTLNDFVLDLDALLKHLQLPKAQLVGNCIGAAVALEFALQQPERVASLALFNVCGGPAMLNAPTKHLARWRPHHAALRALQRQLIALGNSNQLRALLDTQLHGTSQPVLPQAMQAHFLAARTDAAHRESLYWLCLGLGSFEKFTRIQTKPAHFPPTLLGWGTHNKVLHPRWATRIADWLQPEEFWPIHQAGHMPNYEQATLFNQRLMDSITLDQNPTSKP